MYVSEIFSVVYQKAQKALGEKEDCIVLSFPEGGIIAIPISRWAEIKRVGDKVIQEIGGKKLPFSVGFVDEH